MSDESRRWVYEQEYDIEHPVPFYKIGTTTLEHIEVVLR